MAEPRPPIGSFAHRDGRLLVGGVPVDRLAQRVGATPFFAYDREKLTGRVADLREALPEQVSLSYAVKANPMPAVVQHLSGLVDSFDVASALEMRTALDTPVPPKRVSFAGPGKNQGELRQAIAAGVTIELESPGEADRVVSLAEELGITPRVAIRVNPDFEVKGSGMRLGGGPQQFGVDSEQVPGLLEFIHSTGAEFVGFHVFAGSQNLQAEVVAEAQRRTVDLVLKLAASSPVPVEYVNLGGGFGIPYFDADSPLDLDVIGANLGHLVEGSIAPHLPDARITLELGRYIVGECGIYVSRVVDRKHSRGKTYLVLDGGLHHQLAASGNFGQVIRRNYPIAVGNRMGEPATETVDVVGCLCTPLDLLGRDVAFPRADVDDLIVIFQAGAYGLTASPTAFLSHPAPAEVMI